MNPVTARFEWRRVLLISLGLFSAQLAWVIYNTYVPIFLQAGAPDFDAHTSVRTFGFGLSATLTGVIMALDNLAAFFIEPLMGPLSDRTRSRRGRRMVYLLAAMPISALALMLIPLAAGGIPAALNGQSQQLGGLFLLMLIPLLTMVISMAVWRTPIFALMADVTPSPWRSHANGVMNLMAGLGGVLAFVLGGTLYRAGAPLPFVAGGLVMLIALGVIVWRVREPPDAPTAAPSQSLSIVALFDAWRQLPREHRRPLALLTATVFCYMLGFHPIEAFFSSYGVNVLGLSEADTGLVLSAAYIAFIVFAVPAGMLAARIGRKRTMQAGLILFALAMLIAFYMPTVGALVALLALGGLAWALIDINGLPMMIDVTQAEHQTGTYAGLYFAATTLAATVAPIVNGGLIDLAGRNYSLMFIIGPIFFALAFLALWGVQGGEAHTGGGTP